MKFNKLALAAAIAAAPAAGFAMEPMEDEALSGVTGQDGLSIGLSVNTTMNVTIEDDDGLGNAPVASTAAYANPGMIQITGMGFNSNGNIDIDIDAGSDATMTSNAQLNVYVDVPNGATLTTGNLTVQGSDGAFATNGAQSATIIPSTTITLGSGLQMEINLGHEGTGEAFINLDANLGTITFGTVGNVADNFAIDDADGSSIFMDAMSVSGLDMTGTTVDVDATAGLQVTVGATALTNVGMTMTDLSLNGGGATVGDVQITGLDLSGTVISINGR